MSDRELPDGSGIAILIAITFLCGMSGLVGILIGMWL